MLHAQSLVTMSEKVNDGRCEISQLSIEEAVKEVEENINMLEGGDVSLSRAKELRDRSINLLQYIEDELEVGDGEISRIEEN